MGAAQVPDLAHLGRALCEDQGEGARVAGAHPLRVHGLTCTRRPEHASVQAYPVPIPHEFISWPDVQIKAGVYQKKKKKKDEHGYACL